MQLATCLLGPLAIAMREERKIGIRLGGLVPFSVTRYTLDLRFPLCAAYFAGQVRIWARRCSIGVSLHYTADFLVVNKVLFLNNLGP